MYEVIPRSNSEACFGLAVTGNSFAAQNTTVVLQKSKVAPVTVRLPLHARSNTEANQPRNSMATAVTMPDLENNNSKSEFKIKVPTIKLKGIEKEMSKCLNEIIKQESQFEALEINRKSDLISATPATFFQGRRLITRTSELPRNIRLQRQRSVNSNMGVGSISSRVIKEDETSESEALLRKLFQNELIQAGTNGEIKPSQPSNENINSHFPVNKPKRLNSAVTSKRMSQMGAAKPVVTFKKYKLFDENYTKTEKVEFPRILTKEVMEHVNNENDKSIHTQEATTMISNFVMVNRVNTENGEENMVLAKMNNNNGRKEVKSLNNIRGTERKPVQAEPEGVKYLRSKSTGNMVRLNNGAKSVNDLSKAKNFLDEARIASMYSILKTNHGDHHELKDTSIMMDGTTAETEMDYYFKQVSLSKLI